MSGRSKSERSLCSLKKTRLGKHCFLGISFSRFNITLNQQALLEKVKNLSNANAISPKNPKNSSF